MFGTIARFKFKPGMRERAQAEFQTQLRMGIPGEVNSYVYLNDKTPDEVWIAVVFESEEAYWANANSPEQNERYKEMMQYMAEEPEWHDGQVIAARG